MLIRQQHCRIWKDYLILQMQVFYTCLPKVFDQSGDFIGSIGYLPLNNNQCRIDMKNKHYRLIQEAKRAWLGIYLIMYVWASDTNPATTTRIYMYINK